MMLTGMPFTRDMLFKRIMPTDRVLEIGPFTKPNLRGPNVRYFDVMDKAALIERAILHEYPHDEPMEIEPGMCLAVHPGFEAPNFFVMVCDNYIVSGNSTDRIHKTERKIFEV